MTFIDICFCLTILFSIARIVISIRTVRRTKAMYRPKPSTPFQDQRMAMEMTKTASKLGPGKLKRRRRRDAQRKVKALLFITTSITADSVVRYREIMEQVRRDPRAGVITPYDTRIELITPRRRGRPVLPRIGP